MNKHQRQWYDAMVERGHTPIMFKDELDVFAYYTSDPHNGPKCEVCDWGTCWHCDDVDVIPDCATIQAENKAIHNRYMLRTSGEPISKRSI